MRSTSWTEGPAPTVDTLIMSLMVRCGEEVFSRASSKGAPWMEGVLEGLAPLGFDVIDGKES